MTKEEKEILTNETVSIDRPSRRMMRSWAKKISRGQAATIPVFVGGEWSLQVMRGRKRVMRVALENEESKGKNN